MAILPVVLLLGVGYLVARAVTDAEEAPAPSPNPPAPTPTPQPMPGLPQVSTGGGVPMEVATALAYEMDVAKLEALAKKYDAIDPKISAMIRQRIALLKGAPSMPSGGTYAANQPPPEVAYALLYVNDPNALDALAIKYDALGDPESASELRAKSAFLRAGGTVPGWSLPPGGMPPSGPEGAPWPVPGATADPGAWPWGSVPAGVPGAPGAPGVPGAIPWPPAEWGSGDTGDGGTVDIPVPGVPKVGARPSWLPAYMQWPPAVYNPSFEGD